METHVESQDYVVMTTHRAYATARQAALDSLDRAGWPRSRVVLAFADGGAEADVENETETKTKTDVETETGGCHRVDLRENLYEYNAFLAATSMLRADAVPPDARFMLLHDTCEVGAEFAASARRLFNEARTGGADILWLSPRGACNLCVFNARAAETASAQLVGKMTMDKMMAIHMEHDRVPESLKRLQLKHAFVGPQPRELGIDRKYSASVARSKLHFPSADIYKFYVYVESSSQHPQRP